MIHVITQPGLTSFEVTLFFCVCLSTYLNSNNKIRKQQQKKKLKQNHKKQGGQNKNKQRNTIDQRKE